MKQAAWCKHSPAFTAASSAALPNFSDARAKDADGHTSDGNTSDDVEVPVIPISLGASHCLPSLDDDLEVVVGRSADDIE